MRRSRTPITAWPAIADLMIVIAIIAVTFSVAKTDAPENESSDTPSPADSLQSELEVVRDSVKALWNSLEAIQERARFGHVPCFGLDADDQPIAAFTIAVLPGTQYRISHALESVRVELERWGKNLDEVFSAAEFGSFADRMLQAGKRSGVDCRYWVYLENRGAEPDRFQLRWLNEISPYVGGATNPSVLRR